MAQELVRKWRAYVPFLRLLRKEVPQGSLYTVAWGRRQFFHKVATLDEAEEAFTLVKGAIGAVGGSLLELVEERLPEDLVGAETSAEPEPGPEPESAG